MKFHYSPILYFALLQMNVNAQFNWQHTDGPIGIAKPQTLSNEFYTFIPDQEYLFRTEDGNYWETIDRPVSRLMAVYQDTLVNIYFDKDTSAGHLQFSIDNGETWTVKEIPNELDHYACNIAICGLGLYIYRLDQNLLYRSSDLGDSWENIALQGITGFRFFTMDERLYLQNTRTLARSDLNGENWEIITPPLEDGRRIVDVVADGHHILVADNGLSPEAIQEGSIWHAHDSVLIWEEAPVLTITTDSDNVIHQIKNQVFAAIDHYILHTEDFGFTWDTLTKLEFANFTWGLANVKDTLLHSTYFQGMYKWDASAEVLTQCNTGLTKGSIWELEMSNDKIWTAGSTGIYNYDLNSGEWSNKMNLPEPYWPYQYNRMASNDLGWVAITNYYDLSFYLSIDSGLTWDTIYIDPMLLGIFEIYLLDETILIISDVTIRSTDKGKNWDYLFWEEDLIRTNLVKFKGRHYMSGQELLYASQDNGLTWDATTPPFRIWALGTYGEDLFAVTYENGATVLYISKDATEWTYAGDGFPFLYPVSGISNKGKHLFCRDNENYYVFNADPYQNTYTSPINPINWSVYPMTKLGSDFLFTQDKIYLGGSGLYQTLIEDPFITNISEEPNEINNIFSLAPNPASHTLEISIHANNPIGTIQLLTSNGVLLRSVFVAKDKETLDIRSLHPGIYYILLTSSNGTSIKSFITID